MILRAYNCEYAEIDLLENVAVLELMRPEIFNNVLLDLTDPTFPAREVAIEDGDKMLTANAICCVSDLLELSLSGKTLLGKLHKHIDNSVFSDPEEKMNLDNSISRLRQYFLETLQCLDVDLETSPTVEVKDVCAMFGLTPFCATDSVACKIEQFITLCSELKLCKVLVLIQAKAYMDDLSLESVYRNALRHRIGLIMVESAHRQEKLYAEKKIIVDKDFSDQIL